MDQGILLKTATATTTIEALRRFFASFGLPEEIISDSGPQFVATEYAHTALPPCLKWGCRVSGTSGQTSNQENGNCTAIKCQTSKIPISVPHNTTFHYRDAVRRIVSSPTFENTFDTYTTQPLPKHQSQQKKSHKQKLHW